VGTSSREQRETLEAVRDPFARNTLRAAYHVRKYILLYVCGALGALALSLFPTLSGGGGPSGTGTVASGAAGSSGQVNGGAGGTTAGGAGSGTVSSGGLSSGGSVGPGGAAGGQAAGATTSGGGGGSASGGPVGQVSIGTGKTKAGYACSNGVHQIPWSNYADPCEAAFTGNNGGATYNGVTGSTITIAERETSDANGANSLETQAEAEAAGGVSFQTNYGYTQKIIQFLNSQFELYGRQVKLQLYNGQGNYTNEELDTGSAQACADADTAANSIHAFGVIDYETYGYETGPFSDCAARYHLYIPNGAAYFPEWWFQQRNPYVWGVTMNCWLISQQVAEFAAKQMAPYPAKWAGNDGVVNMQNTQRKFGTWVPSNAEYQSCVQYTLSLEENQYHIAKGRENQYNYPLDISQWPQDAQQAVIQFSADHDTTVVLASDPISPIFLTQDAVNQNYYPEWMLIGVAQTDFDSWAQLWDPKAITNHLFGLSQAAAYGTLMSPSSDAGQSLGKIGLPMNIDSVTDYYLLLSMFDQLQAAGPDLTPAAIGVATAKLPESTGPFGTWHYGSTHSAIIDSREIYWDASAPSPGDGKAGTYQQIYGGQRFQSGQFPTGQPPFFQ
jgi:hypothetical protein